ncbi:MAG: hypothetical protein ACTSXL_04535 [Alphaproteobacteria bacterium]
MKKIILCFFVGILSGCYNTHQISSSKSLRDYPNEGIIIGSIATPKGFTSSTLKYKGKESGNIRAKSTFLTDKKKRKFFAIHLPSGSYAFNDFVIFSNGLLEKKEISPNIDFNLPFRVNKNQILYVGSFNFNFESVYAGYGMLGGFVNNEGKLEVRNNFYDDLKSIKKEFPKLETRKAKNQTIRREMTNSPIVIIK